MRQFFSCVLLFTLAALQLNGQRACSSAEYAATAFANNPSLASKISNLETMVQQQVALRRQTASRGEGDQLITIPVVVHVLYHLPEQNISDAVIVEQINVLNKAFRRLGADTADTPERFRNRAADINIEFKLATSDSRKRSTTGIIRKYTPIEIWDADDKMKSSAEMGNDPWDAESYLNIWVVNLRRQQAYATFPGSDLTKDGIVISFSAFGVNPKGRGGYELGKTLVHEAGHWLGLRHIWGDAYCGDDLVDDTPVQGNFTNGCPSGIRLSCSNRAEGDMYMNYMDLSADACTNMFTEGQKDRMRSFFSFSGGRFTLLYSAGLQPPVYQQAPVEEEYPRWLHPQLFPNPAASQITIDISYDQRWIGKTLLITNMQGQTLQQVRVAGKIQQIDVSKLVSGIYFIYGKKEDGDVIKHKFIKL